MGRIADMHGPRKVIVAGLAPVLGVLGGVLLIVTLAGHGLRAAAGEPG